MLIDHLEQGNEAHQPLILSILADMLKNAPLAHEYWQEWRSERDQATAYQVLLRLWRTAEVDKEITREGVLTSIHRPLEGSGKRALFLPKHEVRASVTKSVGYRAARHDRCTGLDTCLVCGVRKKGSVRSNDLARLWAPTMETRKYEACDQSLLVGATRHTLPFRKLLPLTVLPGAFVSEVDL